MKPREALSGLGCADVRIKCFVCRRPLIQSLCLHPTRRSEDLAQLGDSFCSPCSPRQKDHPDAADEWSAPALRCSRIRNGPSADLASTLRVAVLVDEAKHLVCELLPALVRVRAGLVRADRQGRIEKQDALLSPRNEIPFRSRLVSFLASSGFQKRRQTRASADQRKGIRS